MSRLFFRGKGRASQPQPVLNEGPEVRLIVRCHFRLRRCPPDILLQSPHRPVQRRDAIFTFGIGFAFG